MEKFVRRTILLLALLLVAPFGVAQDAAATTPLDGLLGLLGINLVALGGSVLVFGRAIQHGVEWLKGVWKGMPHFLHYVLPFAFGLLGSYLIFNLVGISDPQFSDGAGGVTWITYGVVGGAIAAGWYRKDKADRVAKAVDADLPPSRREVL